MPKRARYGEYCEKVGDLIYAVVNIPQGDGKYKKKRKRVADKISAKQWALEELQKAKRGEIDASEGQYTFADLARWYKKKYIIPPVYQDGKKLYGLRTYREQERRIERFIKKWGLIKLAKFNSDVLDIYKKERLKTVSITAVNRDFALLRPMMKKAKIRKWITEDPFEQGEKLIEVALESKRHSPMTSRMYARLLARARKSEQPLLFYVILVCANTGARPSEIFPFDAYDEEDKEIVREPLIWQNILEFKFEAMRLVSYKGRVRTERLVPISEYFEKHLRVFYDKSSPAPSDLLFPIKSFKRSWKTLCKNTKVSNVRLRDFRHYHNSRLNKLGMDDITRQLLLGHSEAKTNKRYTELDMDFMRIIRNKMD